MLVRQKLGGIGGAPGASWALSLPHSDLLKRIA